MLRYFISDCDVIFETRTDPCGWMRPIFGSPVGGRNLYRTLDSEGNTIDFLLSPYRDRMAAKHFIQLSAASGTSSATSDQRRWASCLPVRHFRTKTNRRAAEDLSLSLLSLHEQRDRARLSFHQEAYRCQLVVSVGRRCNEHNPRL